MAIATRSKNFPYEQNFEISTGPSRGVPMGVVKTVTPAIIGNFVFSVDNFRNFFNEFEKHSKKFPKKIVDSCQFFPARDTLLRTGQKLFVGLGKSFIATPKNCSLARHWLYQIISFVIMLVIYLFLN